MPSCRICGSDLSEAARSCPSCGAASQGAESATMTAHGAGIFQGSPVRASALEPDAASRNRFVPGLVLAGRYRIVGLLGRGGMGEVYRADDLLLDQPVALKFLPSDLSIDAERLARFRAEVRAARQVSHPNVCRVYDIAEGDGQPFLSMEYVDGEDLASLLRRIGRLPQDKGIEIARQICAGLAAAHERGVIHRDLKPANVMLDGRGQVRIADFGLAGAAVTSEAPAGTPSYMAPELFEGRPATVQTDLYALGLLLYELFTGRPMFAPGTLLDLARAHRDRTPSSTRTVAPDLDPAIDTAIERCLANDPRLRPASALAVAAALPGGDPLAAALARGETPSPALVAAAGGEGALPPLVALGLWLVIIAGVLAAVPIMERKHPIRAVTMPLSPDVLKDRAVQIIRLAGYTDAPADATGGFVLGDFVSYLETLPAADRWQHLKSDTGAPVVFWYRESPRPLVNSSWFSTRVGPYQPPPATPGSKIVSLDTRGRLLTFIAAPPRSVASPTEHSVDWSPLFGAAGLDMRGFTQSKPRWRPRLHHAEVHVAWEGPRTEESGTSSLWVETGASQGLPIYFELFRPWERPDEGYQPRPESGARLVLRTMAPLVIMAALAIAGVMLTIHNLRARRGDVRSATRVAIFIFAVTLCSAAMTSDYAADPQLLFNLIVMMTAQATLLAGIVWAGYVAIEPHVRRWWPETLISWTRLLDGRWRDPRVARDILIGLGFTAAIGTLLGWVVPSPWPISTVDRLTSVWMLDGLRFFAGWLIGTLRTSVVVSVTLLLQMLVVTVIVRRRWLAVGLVYVFVAAMAFVAPVTLAERLTMVVAQGFALVLLVRVGVLAFAAAQAGRAILYGLPLTADASVWYATYGWFTLAGFAVAATAVFHLSRGGRPLLARSWLAE